MPTFRYKDSDQYLTTVIKYRKLYRVAANLGLSDLARLLKIYIVDVQTTRTKIVSLVGGAASGKTTLVKCLEKEFGDLDLAVLCTDDYSLGTRSYRKRNINHSNPLEKRNFALLDKLVHELVRLEPGQMQTVPVYNPKNGAGIPPHTHIEQKYVKSDRLRSYKYKQITGPIQVIIVEGDFQPLADPDLVIYLHLSDEIRLANRIKRDSQDRGYPNLKVIEESFYTRQVEQHIPFTLPVSNSAHILIWTHLRKTPVQRQFYDYDVYVHLSSFEIRQ